MEPLKITKKKLLELADQIDEDPEKAIGNYLYKGYRIQISKYKSSGAERYMRLYHNRRAQGLCIRCGAKVTKKNPRTGKLYRLCEKHRDITDK